MTFAEMRGGRDQCLKDPHPVSSVERDTDDGGRRGHSPGPVATPASSRSGRGGAAAHSGRRVYISASRREEAMLLPVRAGQC